MRTIKLTHGKEALVDDSDYERLIAYKWYAYRGSKTDPNLWYARARVDSRKQLPMHRLIMDAPAHLLVDHIDGNGLNNQRSNLRLATHRQNARNNKRARAIAALQPRLLEVEHDS